jgi:hypothetical protein
MPGSTTPPQSGQVITTSPVPPQSAHVAFFTVVSPKTLEPTDRNVSDTPPLDKRRVRAKGHPIPVTAAHFPIEPVPAAVPPTMPKNSMHIAAP